MVVSQLDVLAWVALKTIKRAIMSSRTKDAGRCLILKMGGESKLSGIEIESFNESHFVVSLNDSISIPLNFDSSAHRSVSKQPSGIPSFAKT